MGLPLQKDKNPKIITLLTDFGEEDWFVGSMKGVMASICPGARTVDITHLIPPGDIRRGALILRCAYRYFPRETVHLAVVDPGVGSDRAILVVRGGGYVFVAPDNGLLSYILADLEEKTIFSATREDLFLGEICDTFHGRDIFAPLAARLAGGLAVEEVGSACGNPVIFTPPVARAIGKHQWEAEVITTDRFGNCITSLSRKQPKEASGSVFPMKIELDLPGEHLILPLVDSYTSVDEGSPLAVWGSCGFLELSVNRGNAARQLSLQAGDVVKMKIE